MRKLPAYLVATFLICASLAIAQEPSQIHSSGTVANDDRHEHKPGKPNILFIIMDDVGIDQLSIFGYGGILPPSTPNLATIAHAGLRFRNVWSMPECSPSRAVFFEGRYPLRTNIYSAILANDLANSQMSPYEVSTPRILKKAGYESAMFGKFHLSGPDNNPYGHGTPHALGWDYFDGFLVAAPAPIDATIGGQFPTGGPNGGGPYTCGFIPSVSSSRPGAPGADAGACFQPDQSCTNLVKDANHPVPGRSCLESGGLFVPNRSCKAGMPVGLDFSVLNGYYVWTRTINDGAGNITITPQTRNYVIDTTNNSAIQWINEKNKEGVPWMSTVSYSTIHTPYQQPPMSLVSPADPDISALSCTGNDPRNVVATRIISNQMLEAMDTEIGNLLVRTGLATFNSDGSLDYHPENTNTTVIIIGDNGTYAAGVKPPFDVNRAKGFVYQTGVWVPLIVAGPQVASPDRDINAMVNVADLYQLFGDLAGLDVHTIVPRSHVVDSVSMLPYLTNPKQAEIRKTNFTQGGNNLHFIPPSPCVIPLSTPATCVQVMTTAATCNYEGGDWYGTGGKATYPSCCAVKNDYDNNPNSPIAGLYAAENGIQILPDYQSATRNDSYKLVQLTEPNCSSTTGEEKLVTEFYKINENVPLPLIDKDGDNLCGADGCPAGLTGAALHNFKQLMAAHQATLASEPSCPGDGNEDKKVNQLDVKNWQRFSSVVNENGVLGGSSWYDFNLDGLTNGDDLLIIQQNLGANCLHEGGKPHDK